MTGPNRIILSRFNLEHAEGRSDTAIDKVENANKTRDLLRVVGVTAIAIGAACALQVLGLGRSTALGKLIWVLAAATIADARTGLIYTATSLQAADGPARLRFR